MVAVWTFPVCSPIVVLFVLALLVVLGSPPAHHPVGVTLATRNAAFRSPTAGHIKEPGSYSVRQRALVVGVNGGNATGCILDANEMMADLIRIGYRPDEITLLENATRSVLLKSMTELVSSLYAGDKAFFYFSGHGGTTFDLNWDELPGHNDSYIHTTTEGILDDEIHATLIRPLRFGVQLFGLVDACRSGQSQEIKSFHPQLPEMFETQAILFAACRDDETTIFLSNHERRGSFTFALRKLLSSGKMMSFQEVLLHMNLYSLRWRNDIYHMAHVQLSALNCFDVSKRLFRF